MSSTSDPRPSAERVAGLERLKSAVAQRRQARDQVEASKGTSAEIEATVSVQAADEQVHARKRWLAWVDERDQE
jgi:hypothetical protein